MILPKDVGVIVSIRAIRHVQDIVKVCVLMRVPAVMPVMDAVKQNVHQVVDSII